MPPSPAIEGEAPPAGLPRVLAETYGIGTSGLQRVPGGWDPRASVWTTVDDDDVRWSVKLTTRDVEFGLLLAAELADDGVVGVVAPRRTRDGAVWTALEDAMVVVSPWIEGVDADPAVVDWHRLGRTLRAVHDHRPRSGLRAPRRGIRRFDRSPRAMISEVDARASEPGADGAVAALWQRTRPRLDALAIAERALKRDRSPTVRVALHGDPHLGNVVVDARGLPWLVDFDEATIAPREADLMLVELGVLFATPIDDEHRRRFRSGYGADALVDEARIVRFGCVRAVEDTTRTFLLAFDVDGAGAEHVATIEGLLGQHGIVTLVETELRGAA